MEMYKTKEVAELLSVSQTTIKRWAAMFPNVFPKDRFGHYIFSQQEVSLLKSIKTRIDQGETLDRITLTGNHQPVGPLQSTRPVQAEDKPMHEMWSRINQIEHSLDQKADEVVSVQLLRQREELEDLRQMIQQLALSIETIQQPGLQAAAAHEELHPVAAAKLKAPPKKRSLLRTLFSL
ncbi:MerR family transcriptional regulator [Paenibacillus pedocola]|uniref:MerR family transcriptional regulator n=1 Tax=Paenibacillus pedocola TaxID=3242193 RepID=UPI0028777692|nr:MerR family transcriptional regulator [Paenibacillus typhae]